MPNTANYTTTQAKADYPPQLRRAAVLELGAKFGFTERTMRTLIEGPEAAIKSHKFGKQVRGYFNRDDVLTALFPPSTNPKA